VPDGLHVTTAPPEPAESTARQWFATTALVIYCSIVLFVTLRPTPIDKGYDSTIDRVLAALHHSVLPQWFGYGELEFSANIVMFVPLGFLIALLLPHRIWWLAALICPTASVCIERAQATLLAERFASLTDVISNSVGGFLGTIVAFLVRAIVAARDEKLIARALRQQNAQR
jgi:glycopeptide antibiotics resistance protein